MKKYEAKFYKNRYVRLIEKIDEIKKSLNKYPTGTAYHNKYFDNADLNYQPMQTFDQATSRIIVRLNNVRRNLDDYKRELDAMRRQAVQQRNYYESIIQEWEARERRELNGRWNFKTRR